MTANIILIFGGIALTIFGLWLRRYAKRQQGYQTHDVITRQMKDPYSQAVWAAFDSGRPTTWKEGVGVVYLDDEKETDSKSSG